MAKQKSSTKQPTRQRKEKKRRRVKSKKTYRIRNWSEYNKALVRRGSLTVWIDEEVFNQWLKEERSGKRGASQKYSDLAIRFVLTLKAIYSQALRQSEGFVNSLFAKAGIDLKVPDYTTVCRRRACLEVSLPHKQGKAGESIHLVIDATGVKVCGEGEWKVRSYGWSKRRVWRKLNIAVDEATNWIEAAVVTESRVCEADVVVDLLEQIEEEIEQVSADGIYDQRKCYDQIRERGARAAIPPRRGAKIWQHGNSKEERLVRDENLRQIRKLGRAKWKEESGYHRRSLSETAMMRYKTIFSDKILAKNFESQACDILLRCSILNQMTELGMPQSYVVQ